MSKDFDEGMAATLNGTKLQWNHKDAWIYVGDLPTALVNELKVQPFYAAVMICESYLNEEETD